MAQPTPKELEDLMEACETADSRTVSALLDRFPDSVNARDQLGWTPLVHAAAGADTDMIELLLRRGADIDAADNNGHTAADMANRLGYTSVADFMKAAADVRALEAELQQRRKDVDDYAEGLSCPLRLARCALKLKR